MLDKNAEIHLKFANLSKDFEELKDNPEIGFNFGNNSPYI